jgi:hypothetical protein
MADIGSSAELLVFSKQQLVSQEMQDYFKAWPNAYMNALRQCNIKETNQLGDDAEKHGAFWQNFWEALPSTPRVRTSAFYRVCDMGEWFCFGDR